MSARERILMIRLLEKLSGSPEYGRQLGIEARMGRTSGDDLRT